MNRHRIRSTKRRPPPVNPGWLHDLTRQGVLLVIAEQNAEWDRQVWNRDDKEAA